MITSILLISCSSIESVGNETKQLEENNEALYGQALLDLNTKNLTDKEQANLDQRYTYLQNQISNILQGEEEMSLAQFTRIKIELDYLKMQNYTPEKIGLLTKNFTQAFSVAENLVEEDYSGLSLGDRYYSLNKSISNLLDREEELKISEYLQIETDLNNLELAGYPIPNKVDELRAKLFQAVLAELESAIINYEIPEVIEEPEQIEEIEETIEGEPEVTSEESEEVTDIVEEIVEEEVEVIETGPRTHLVKMIDGGFDMTDLKDLSTEDFDIYELNINVGDTIEWKNVRAGSYKIALLVGNRKCSNIKSGFFNSGESFSWTFNETGTCWVSDGIFTTQAIKVVVY